MCFSFAIKKAPANRRSENKNFICKFEMHPFTQVGCIVSIYGTQARMGSTTASGIKAVMMADRPVRPTRAYSTTMPR